MYLTGHLLENSSADGDDLTPLHKRKKEKQQHSMIFLLTHLSLASLLWDIGKQNSPRCDAAERGVPSGAILFA